MMARPPSTDTSTMMSVALSSLLSSGTFDSFTDVQTPPIHCNKPRQLLSLLHKQSGSPLLQSFFFFLNSINFIFFTNKCQFTQSIFCRFNTHVRSALQRCVARHTIDTGTRERTGSTLLWRGCSTGRAGSSSHRRWRRRFNTHL